jgi:hypothetical protein
VGITALQVGTIALLIAAGMGIYDLVFTPIFRITLGGFTIPLWTLLALYAALQLLSWRATERGAVLSDEEVERWGELLTEITPALIEALEAGKPVTEVARKLEEEHSLPVDVTLRYVIALGQARVS